MFIIIIIIHEFQRDTRLQKLQGRITVSVTVAGDVHRHTIGGTVLSSMHA